LHYVIIGNGGAGTSALQTIRELDKTSDITILSREQYPAYSPCSLPNLIAREIDEPTIFRFDKKFYQRNNAKFLKHSEAIQVLPKLKKIKLENGITIGFETNGPVVEDVVVRNCDILQARGGSRVDGHSAFSIICDGPATIRNILYEDIRVEEDVLKLFELHITDGTKYGINPPGHIKDIHLKDIQWTSLRPIILYGFDESHRIQNVKFENCTIEGELLDNPRPDIFNVNDFVDHVTFEQEVISE